MRTEAVLLLLAALSSIWPAILGLESLPRDFPCTREEYECLSLGRLLYPKDGKCYEIGVYNTPCSEGQFYRANKTLAFTEGRLQGECLPPPCSSKEQLAASTGRCEETFKICDVGMNYNVWGEVVCGFHPDVKHFKRLNDLWNGRCIPPQHMVPVPPPEFRKIFLHSNIPCSEQEHQCYQKGEVLFRGKCWPLRKQGPCAEGEWLVLDENAVHISESGIADPFKMSRIVPICVRRPCPAGQLLPVPGSIVGEQCISASLLRRRMCAAILMAMDVFGRGGCSSYFSLIIKEELPPIRNNGSCSVPTIAYSNVSKLSGVECPRGNDGSCVTLSEVQPSARYVLLPEDE